MPSFGEDNRPEDNQSEQFFQSGVVTPSLF